VWNCGVVIAVALSLDATLGQHRLLSVRIVAGAHPGMTDELAGNRFDPAVAKMAICSNAS
jgi:hypothetical protein